MVALHCTGTLVDLTACDEYPNFASGEAGPKVGVATSSTFADTFNQRSASLCIMNSKNNSDDGSRLSSFKAATNVGDLVGAYFFVVPMPSLPTNWTGLIDPLEHPARADYGSYPGAEPQLGSPREAWWSTVCQ